MINLDGADFKFSAKDKLYFLKLYHPAAASNRYIAEQSSVSSSGRSIGKRGSGPSVANSKKKKEQVFWGSS